MPIESKPKSSISGEFDDHDDLCDEFLAMIEENDEGNFLHGSGVSLGTQHWTIVIGAKEGEPSAKPSLIQLFSSRRDLVKAFLQADGLFDMVGAVTNLQDWLSHRGCVIGIRGANFWAKLKLGVFDKTSALFGYSTQKGS